jgi:hypothetical protein
LKSALNNDWRRLSSDEDLERFPAVHLREYLLRFGFERCYVSIDSAVVRLAIAKQSK